MANISEEIKKAMNAQKLIIGRDRVLKALRAKDLKKVIVASNCEARIEETLLKFTSLSGVEFVKAEISNKDLSVVCKKPFMVSILGVKA